MTRFITANGNALWAAIEPDTRCQAPQIAERRFAAYLKPFASEDSAIAALVAAGGSIDPVSPPPRPGRIR